MIRVERHVQGPRVFLLGRRVHEYVLGLALAATLCLGWVAEVVHPSLAVGAVAATAIWLVAKDWRDLFPSKRDSAGWRLGIHRRFAPLRPPRPGESTATIAALLALAVAIVNLVSTLTPNVPWRARLLLQVEPVSALPALHALALPAAAALALVAVNLARRRRRALHAAVAILALVGMLDVLKGLDVEEAVLSWALAALLWWRREAFYVRHEPFELRRALWRLPLFAFSVLLVAVGAVWMAAPSILDPVLVVREALGALTWQHGPAGLGAPVGWPLLAVRFVSMASIAVAASLFFKPLAATRSLEDHRARPEALRLVRAHGRDTLAFFKLREDAQHFFSSDRRAFLAYRVENGVLLVSGDPVGEPDALPELLREVCSFADLQGLKVGAVGVGSELLPLYKQAGLHALYIGDEAIVDTYSFSLEGRSIRKVRQSVNRLEAAGYAVDVHRGDEIDTETAAELERVSALWRGTVPERGFSMAMDSLGGAHQADALIVVARDRSGSIRGFLHFVPTYGRRAMSLSHMRRDRDTPNGLTEFLVVCAITELRQRGIEEISLNFAAFARMLRNPDGLFDRVLGRVLSLANPFFQIESLFRFNLKFRPRWEPRYLLHEGALSLPRIGFAALRAEGQVLRLRPRPTRA